jgi:uncharacterized protein YaaN involved in tellurite resistance
MTAQHSASDTFVLAPPEPVAPVRAEQASGIVPLDPSMHAETARRTSEYVESFAGLDARSPEFARRLGEIASLGAADLRGAAQQSNRMLDRAVRSPAAGGEDAQARVGSALAELRRTVEDLDPRDAPGKGARRLLSRLPGGNRFRDHVAEYATSQAALSRIVGSLRGGQDELRRDNAALHTERPRLWETMGKLQEYAVLTEELDAAVGTRIAADPAVGVETLRTAFRQIHETLDAIDTYRARATESMAATVDSLAGELRTASAHLERARATDALDGGAA